MSKSPKNKPRPLKNVGPLLGIGTEMGVIIFASNFLGDYLDTKYQTTYLENVLTLAGVFLAMFMVVYRVNRFNKK